MSAMKLSYCPSRFTVEGCIMSKRQQRDFKKVKEKGYGKKVKAASHTNTSFKTRALVVPYQKVADEERLGREEVTHRKLSLEELLSKLSHHNAKVKKDALHGLRELVTQHSVVLDGKLHVVLTALLECLVTAGENHKVDQALVQLARALLSTVSSVQMETHADLVWAYLKNSFTNVKMPTRLVGLQVFDEFLELCPSLLLLVVDDEKLLSLLAAMLLNRSVIQPSATKQKIWKSVLLFVRSRSDKCREFIGTILGPCLIEDLVEHVKAADATVLVSILEVLSFADQVPQRVLDHLSCNFPIQSNDQEANVRVCSLLLESPVHCAAACEFAAKSLKSPSLPSSLRALLLQACREVWSRPHLGGPEGLALVEAFASLLSGRVADSVKIDCVFSLGLVLLNEGTPEDVLKKLLKFCARTLWQQPESASCASILEALCGFVRKPSDLVSEFLSQTLLPVIAVRLGNETREGSFGRLALELQVALVRLFSGLSESASPDVRFAWSVVLANHADSAVYLLDVLHSGRVRLFADVADYYSFLGANLVGPCSLQVCLKLCKCIRDALPEWEDAEQCSLLDLDGGQFAFNVLKDQIERMIARHPTKALLLISVLSPAHEAVLSLKTQVEEALRTAHLPEAISLHLASLFISS